MAIFSASCEAFEAVKNIICHTIETVYPRYYPKGVVDFFLAHHSDENIKSDIDKGNVYLFSHNSNIVGTGSIQHGNEIARVFVLPEFQGRGFGSEIIEHLERQVACSHNFVSLHASLPAYLMYIKRGYTQVAFETIIAPGETILCVPVLQKKLQHEIPETGYYNGRIFSVRENSSNGQVSGETVFIYHQKGATVWAEYSGGEIVRGYMIGTAGAKNVLTSTISIWQRTA